MYGSIEYVPYVTFHDYQFVEYLQYVRMVIDRQHSRVTGWPYSSRIQLVSLWLHDDVHPLSSGLF